MSYKVEVYNTDEKEVICLLGKDLTFEQAELIKYEAKNSFKIGIIARIKREKNKKW